MNKDRYLAIATLVIVGILLIESGDIPGKSSWQPYGSAMYPRFLLALIALLSLVLLVRSFLTAKPATPQSTATFHSLAGWFRHYRIIIALFGLFGLYALLLPMLGYLISTTLFMVSSQGLLLGCDTRRKWLINLGITFTLVPLVYAIFQYGLNVWLP
ncbi:tripartite tricarboxylate transporter TctB family protein [Aidingimonas halophila]|nr:tripartite tricarboxylate transporter TctB family protein [Aidingimonas halophila]GHC24012.1 hypothetical protein GCM10008094_13660 [Aidingimonas halophila]